jgi:hypothetical protein
MAGLHSIAGNIIVLIATLIAIFNVDLKILFFDVSTDKGFSLLNEIIFFILGLELLLLILFKKNYIGSFFFYLDFLAVLSMIPDTDFIMKALLPNDVGGHSAGLDSTHHLIKASAASQAGARYIKNYS